MRAYYAEPLLKFLREPTSSIVGKLSTANANAHFLQYSDATLVWRDTIDQLRAVLSTITKALPDTEKWGIVLEYPIPRRQKRIDLVLLGNGIVYVVEFKTRVADRSAIEQVEDYAMDLRDFHAPSASLVIVPIVVSMEESELRRPNAARGESAFSCSFEGFPELLVELARRFDEAPAIDLDAWNKGAYRPVPPIVQAAQAVFGGMEVREVAHSHAGEENLTKTVDAIYSVVEQCRNQRAKAVVFVTGIPGSGKTLAGLRAVHDPRLVEIAGNEATFLSGNGPLVDVLREALVRDFRKRLQSQKRSISASKKLQRIGTEKNILDNQKAALPRIVGEALTVSKTEWKETKKQIERKVRTLIESVHVFARENHERKDAPNNRVIVFDEAQRAWNAARNAKKFKRQISEPEMLLSIMDRHDWAVVVALVGGGQEINDGEAGLLEWGAALNRFHHWHVVCSPYVLSSSAEDRFRLTNDASIFRGRLLENTALHLETATRDIQAKGISTWVDAILRGDVPAAQESGIAPHITRDLNRARKWLLEHRKEPGTAGLVGSASAARLRVDGLEPSYEFHSNFNWPLWFLNRPEDVRSCSKLEIIATQFEVQGLELDWVAICWGDDLVWWGQQWHSHNFNHRRWRPNLDQEEHRYRINAYRVLLTRARRGSIIYVPKPPDDDVTRMARELDSTYEFFLCCGAKPL